MAGRLEQYDDFIQKSQYNMTTQKKPIQKKEKKQVKKQLQSSNMQIVLKLSRERSMICCFFYNKKNSKGNNEKVYKMAVIPKKSLIKKGRMYIEIIDVKSLTRKILKRDRIIKVKLTDKKFDINQSTIYYKK